MTYIQFISFICISIGIGNIIGRIIIKQYINIFGIILTSLGTGIFIGMYIALYRAKKNNY